MDAPLVAEIEWSLKDGDIKDDFEKLLVATARAKLMVFQKRTAREVDQTIKAMEAEIREFRIPSAGQGYLLSGFAIDEARFMHLSVKV